MESTYDEGAALRGKLCFVNKTAFYSDGLFKGSRRAEDYAD